MKKYTTRTTKFVAENDLLKSEQLDENSHESVQLPVELLQTLADGVSFDHTSWSLAVAAEEAAASALRMAVVESPGCRVQEVAGDAAGCRRADGLGENEVAIVDNAGRQSPVNGIVKEDDGVSEGCASANVASDQVADQVADQVVPPRGCEGVVAVAGSAPGACVVKMVRLAEGTCSGRDAVGGTVLEECGPASSSSERAANKAAEKGLQNDGIAQARAVSDPVDDVTPKRVVALGAEDKSKASKLPESLLIPIRSAWQQMAADIRLSEERARKKGMGDGNPPVEGVSKKAVDSSAAAERKTKKARVDSYTSAGRKSKTVVNGAAAAKRVVKKSVAVGADPTERASKKAVGSVGSTDRKAKKAVADGYTAAKRESKKADRAAKKRVDGVVSAERVGKHAVAGGATGERLSKKAVVDCGVPAERVSKKSVDGVVSAKPKSKRAVADGGASVERASKKVADSGAAVDHVFKKTASGDPGSAECVSYMSVKVESSAAKEPLVNCTERDLPQVAVKRAACADRSSLKEAAGVPASSESLPKRPKTTHKRSSISVDSALDPDDLFGGRERSQSHGVRQSSSSEHQLQDSGRAGRQCSDSQRKDAACDDSKDGAHYDDLSDSQYEDYRDDDPNDADYRKPSSSSLVEGKVYAFRRRGATVPPGEVGRAKKPYACGACGKAYKTAARLAKHQARHERTRCGPGTEALTDHALRYECHLCPAHFRKQSAKDKHLLSHYGFVCKKCRMIFPDALQLQKHMREQHGRREEP